MNTHGNILKITTFGESHGTALGVVIDGFPAGFKVDMHTIQRELDRRKPGQSHIVSQRKEDNSFQILSGIFEGKTTGHPITLIVYNEDQRSRDYENIKNIFRPNHADLTYEQKYGIRDYRGGGRSSGRETVSRVLAGAIAKQYLQEKLGVEIFAYTKQIGECIAKEINLEFIEKNVLRTADENVADTMIQLVEEIRSKGDSIGGIIECIIKNPPKNLGEPVFLKIKSVLASSMLSIGGVLGFEYGAGFDTIHLTGNTYNEGFMKNEVGDICSQNNRYAGILGGISSGEDILFRVAVKPSSSIYKGQQTVDKNGESVNFQIHGRHDPCILPRVIPVIESMVAIDILDLYLLDKSRR